MVFCFSFLRPRVLSLSICQPHTLNFGSSSTSLRFQGPSIWGRPWFLLFLPFYLYSTFLIFISCSNQPVRACPYRAASHHYFIPNYYLSSGACPYRTASGLHSSLVLSLQVNFVSVHSFFVKSPINLLLANLFQGPSISDCPWFLPPCFVWVRFSVEEIFQISLPSPISCRAHPIGPPLDFLSWVFWASFSLEEIFQIFFPSPSFS